MPKKIAKAVLAHQVPAGNRICGQAESEKKTEPAGDKKKEEISTDRSKLVRSVLILLLAVLLAFTGLFYGLTGNFDKIDTDKDVFAIDSNVEDELSGYRNIAILGSDARSDEGYDGSRTDAIIVMSIKKSTGDIRLISVMRDSYLQMEYMDGTQILDKVTHANHWKDAANVCASLNQSLDLNIDEFVMFNWKAVADAVDCLGGIEINVRKKRKGGDMNIWGNETARNVGREYHRIEKKRKTDAGRGYRQQLTAESEKTAEAMQEEAAGISRLWRPQ